MIVFTFNSILVFTNSVANNKIHVQQTYPKHTARILKTYMCAPGVCFEYVLSMCFHVAKFGIRVTCEYVYLFDGIYNFAYHWASQR